VQWRLVAMALRLLLFAAGLALALALSAAGCLPKDVAFSVADFTCSDGTCTGSVPRQVAQ
jgi:hypothetical protein